jgi:ABC-type proline/glycine betaine transport system substrate-binding protein
MNNINILVDAKKEYTNQLQKILTPRIYEGFKSIYEDIINIVSKELEEKKPQTVSIVKTFQKMLKEIPQWNQDMIKKEYERI